MSYKNSMKLFASNFALVWKQLLYLLCTLLIFSLCSYTVTTPVIDLLKDNGIAGDFKLLFNTVYGTPSELALNISDVLKHIITILIENFSGIWLSLIGTILLCFLLPYILTQISIYNISSILYQKFTMNMDVGYMQNFLRTLKQGLKYAFANLIFILPFVAIFVVLLEIYLLIANTIVSAIIGLIGFMALIILVMAFKITIFTNYTAYMVENDADAFVAFAKGVATSLKNFWKPMSISIILLLTIIMVNGFIAVFTFFSGLIITIPATYVLIAIYNLVTYFNNKGIRYYLSNTIIYNPVKYTVKKDDFDYVSISVPEATKEIQVTTTVMKKKYKKTKSINTKPKTKKTKTKKQKLNKD